MTGFELARAVRAVTGKVAVPVAFDHSTEYVYAQKADLVKSLEGIGNTETQMELAAEEGGFFLKYLD
jgi:hypothetical protein